MAEIVGFAEAFAAGLAGALAEVAPVLDEAALDTNSYQRGIKITDKEMKAFEAAHLQRHKFHGDWNYTVTAAPDDDTTRPNQQE